MVAVRRAFTVGCRGRLGQAQELDGAFLLWATEPSLRKPGTVIPVDGGHQVSSL